MTPYFLDPEDLPRPPRYATRLTQGLPNYGHQVSTLSGRIGRPPLPWQQYAAALLTEQNEPGSHFFWRYQTVVILVPRQAGKTTLMRSVVGQRCIARPRTEVIMAAQLGKDSSDRWADLIDDLETSPRLASYLDIKRGKGSEVAKWPNRSKILPFTPTVKGVHGKSPNTALHDEAWAFSTEDIEPVLTAVNPAMITKRDRQRFIISAAGDASSTWLNGFQDDLRETCNQPGSTTAYLEWSPPADDIDPEDEAEWDYHPGLDGLITIDDLRAARAEKDMTPQAWARSYMNLRQRGRKAIVSLISWDLRRNRKQKPPAPESVAYAFAVAEDRSRGSIWTAWVDAAGITQLHVFETFDNLGKLATAVSDLVESGVTMYADDGGQTRVMVAHLTTKKVPVETVPGGAPAWATFKGGVKEATIEHDGSPAVRDALEVAAEARRSGLAVLDRVKSLGPIDALEAAMVATWFAPRLRSTTQVW